MFNGFWAAHFLWVQFFASLRTTNQLPQHLRPSAAENDLR